VHHFLERAMLHEIIDGISEVAELAICPIDLREAGLIGDDSF
jgi:hypothetical protein